VSEEEEGEEEEGGGGGGGGEDEEEEEAAEQFDVAITVWAHVRQIICSKLGQYAGLIGSFCVVSLSFSSSMPGMELN
jgi:uncharacterized membrane protein